MPIDTTTRGWKNSEKYFSEESETSQTLINMLNTTSGLIMQWDKLQRNYSQLALNTHLAQGRLSRIIFWKDLSTAGTILVTERSTCQRLAQQEHLRPERIAPQTAKLTRVLTSQAGDFHMPR